MRLRKTGSKPVLCFDLENRPLAYWYDGQTTSEITAFGWKWSNQRRVHTMVLLPNGKFLINGDVDGGVEVDDDLAYTRFCIELREAGLVYGHNIRRHDLPMLNAGLIRRELPPLPPLLTSDTCRDIPKVGGMSKSLENLAALYDLPGKKFTMAQPMWEDANRLTDEGVALARKRVVSDVLLQERLRSRLMELRLLGEPRVWRP